MAKKKARKSQDTDVGSSAEVSAEVSAVSSTDVSAVPSNDVSAVSSADVSVAQSPAGSISESEAQSGSADEPETSTAAQIPDCMDSVNVAHVHLKELLEAIQNGSQISDPSPDNSAVLDAARGFAGYFGEGHASAGGYVEDAFWNAGAGAGHAVSGSGNTSTSKVHEVIERASGDVDVDVVGDGDVDRTTRKDRVRGNAQRREPAGGGEVARQTHAPPRVDKGKGKARAREEPMDVDVDFGVLGIFRSRMTTIR
ncbi:hypothetical protein B0H14DRAFT_3858868 [Mycena olivaceomarginata]|nr:hypothetical protein B0H14DRAFT_3858868 [Mycena olivaceomarginata]